VEPFVQTQPAGHAEEGVVAFDVTVDVVVSDVEAVVDVFDVKLIEDEEVEEGDEVFAAFVDAAEVGELVVELVVGSEELDVVVVVSVAVVVGAGVGVVVVVCVEMVEFGALVVAFVD
jgi:hypothetical protein